MARAKPKLDWLDAARAELNDDPGFRKLGSTDLVLGLALGDEVPVRSTRLCIILFCCSKCLSNS